MSEAYATASIGELLEAFAKASDEAAQLSALLASVNSRMAAIKGSIKHKLIETGIDKASGSGLTASLRDRMKAKYDPEKWEQIVAWAVSSGHDHIVQRRLTDAAVVELVTNGIVLPDGLSVESFTDIDVRRTK